MSLINNTSGLIKKYIKLLEDYRGTLTETQNELKSLSATEEDQMAAVQVALDLTYLKEELDVMRPSQEQMKIDVSELKNLLETPADQGQIKADLAELKTLLENQSKQEQIITELADLKALIETLHPQQEEIFDKIGKIDNIIIEPIKKNYTANKNATMEKLDEVIKNTKKSNGGLKTALGFSLFFNVLSVGGLVFIILYLLGIIAL